eukprot:5500817-Prymnesium_polylepis.3
MSFTKHHWRSATAVASLQGHSKPSPGCPHVNFKAKLENGCRPMVEFHHSMCPPCSKGAKSAGVHRPACSSSLPPSSPDEDIPLQVYGTRPGHVTRHVNIQKRSQQPVSLRKKHTHTTKETASPRHFMAHPYRSNTLTCHRDKPLLLRATRACMFKFIHEPVPPLSMKVPVILGRDARGQPSGRRRPGHP